VQGSEDGVQAAFTREAAEVALAAFHALLRQAAVAGFDPCRDTAVWAPKLEDSTCWPGTSGRPPAPGHRTAPGTAPVPLQCADE
jgi:hypothetical protein